VTVEQEMRQRHQFVLWRRESGTKMLYRALPPRHKASTTNPSTWSSYDDATAAKAALDAAGETDKRIRRFDGIGYVFSDEDPFVGIDLDNCVTDGEVYPKAQAIVDMFPDAYRELSQSGNGIHIIERGALPEGCGHKADAPWPGGKLEVYDRARFFALTGQQL
jgi:putative DNA primase/helicase